MSSTVGYDRTTGHEVERRRTVEWWSRLGGRLALKPYGDELLTRSADFWIFSARIIILTMAVAEAIAWGYVGSLMSRSHPMLVAAIAGLFVFILIWIIDASFMTLDLSRGHYERALHGTRVNRLGERLKLAGGVGARIAIVTASLVITAPFLAQAIFSEDVRNEMSRRNAIAVTDARVELEQPYLARIATLRQEQRDLEQERVREAAGTGLSGRYGRGPVLETIERQLAEKRSEVEAVDASRVAVLARFDGLTRTQLEEQYGVQFLSPGVRSSRAVLDELMKGSQFIGAEIAVRAFLAFLFIGLLILKLFQPRSVAVYFNEQLHSIHDAYRKGIFDAWLPEQETMGRGGSIDPLRFEEWCLGTYAMIRKEEERRRESARELRMHEILVEQWQRLEATTLAELDPLVQRHDAATAAVHELESDLHEIRTALAMRAEELQRVEASASSLRKHLDRGEMSGAGFDQTIATLEELEERRRQLLPDVRHREGSLESCRRKLESKRAEAARLQDEISGHRTVLSEARCRISDERVRVAAALTSRGESGRFRTQRLGTRTL